MNLSYLIPRMIRHFLPEEFVRFMLLRSLVIKPGLETVDPYAAVQRYVEALAEHGDRIAGKRVLVFGYGGRFDIGIGLLAAGAAYVGLCDRFARPDNQHNAGLLPAHDEYLAESGGVARPRSDRMELIEVDVRYLKPTDRPPYDLVISNSVLEHVEDADQIIPALARLTSRRGHHIHFVDLRDHFFKYPFEMLAFSERTWRGWLNPGTNHNRLRIWDYSRIFGAAFERVETNVLERDEQAFLKVEPRVRLEFRSGQLQDDAATLIRIWASGPIA